MRKRKLAGAGGGMIGRYRSVASFFRDQVGVDALIISRGPGGLSTGANLKRTARTSMNLNPR